jgi:glycosyltransferase involved in cell wall biosynthesis
MTATAPAPPTTASRPIRDSTFALVANGYGDSPPAGPFREYLMERGAQRVTTIFHPLNLDSDPHHTITAYDAGGRVHTRAVRLPSRPPHTYPLDFLVPPWPETVDGWFGFNNLACARGLVARRMRRAGRVVYWAIDFVPDRFGPGLLTRAYDTLDRWCCLHADAWFDLTEAALEGRAWRHGLTPGTGAATRVVPIGAWLDRLPTVSADGWRRRRVVYTGHLVPRQGVKTLMEALALLAGRGVGFEARIGGRGPLEAELREAASGAALDGRVSFPGFFPDHRQVEAFLAESSVAVAPYDTSPDSFSRFADPSKLKSYIAAGLPTITTDVPPNAAELARHAGTDVVPFDPAALADAIERALDSPEEWAARRAAALEYAQRFDWARIFDGAAETAGFTP